MKVIIIFVILSTILFAKIQTIVFGAGCFWGVEKYFESFKGVIEAQSGYAGGDYSNPTYKVVLRNSHQNSVVVNYTESVKVQYNDTKVSTEELIKSFWELHNPTQGWKQGNDIGNNYRSAIYYTTKEQRVVAYKTKKIFQELLKRAGYGKITTEIKPLDRFYLAEDYHQNYLKKHPRGYCPNHATGVKFTKGNSISKVTPLGGKEILVISSPNCPFCERFKEDIVKNYKSTIPLRVTRYKNIREFKLNNKVAGTPTIFFIKDGKELYSHTGYMDRESFYKRVAILKLGKSSKAFDVAFNKSTDARFCKKYKEFKNSKDGVFVDKVSGDILFDTKDRFNSQSGWLSFYKAFKGSVTKREDNSYGMHRVEVIAKKSGAHLGHLFKMPNGRNRFCINATILEFIPRDKIKNIR